MGNPYRTPGNSEFTEALGWCLWNFLYLEETIVRWLWLLDPTTPLSKWRAKTAFPKGTALADVITTASLPADLRSDLEQWIERYKLGVREMRNVVAHGHAFTVKHDEDGWVPGLGYTDPKGNYSEVARSPEELHTIALRIDQLKSELTLMEARLPR